MKNTNNTNNTQDKIKFQEIQGKTDAFQYASEWHLPKVPFFRMWEHNSQDEKKCVKLAVALQGVFNGANETVPFKVLDLALQGNEYLAETSIGNFILKYEEEEEIVEVTKTKKTIKKEKEVVEPQIKDVQNVQSEVVEPQVQKVQEEKIEIKENRGFSLRLFGKEILGWN